MPDPLLKPGDTLHSIWLPEGRNSPLGTAGASLHPPPGLYHLKAKSITIDQLPGNGGYYLVAVIVWDDGADPGRPDVIIPLHMAEAFAV